ncbi:MAG: hypothetical protein GX591_11125 [Planctomycetes bacterium]|nr:hypothetical protein [Planctomycetota bacterium]
MNESVEPHDAEPSDNQPEVLPYATTANSETSGGFVLAGIAGALVVALVAPVWLTVAVLIVLVLSVPFRRKPGRRLIPLAFILGVGMLAVLLGLAIQSSPRRRSTAHSPVLYCMMRLRGIGNAIAIYGMEHADAWPPDLYALVLDYHVDERQLACPADAVRGGIDFFYIPPAWAGDPSPPPEDTTIIACDLKKNHAGGSRNVLFRNWQVRNYVRDPDFQSLLSRPENAAFAAALRAAEGP